jgi:hypothetical protein
MCEAGEQHVATLNRSNMPPLDCNRPLPNPL